MTDSDNIPNINFLLQIVVGIYKKFYKVIIFSFKTTYTDSIDKNVACL